MPLGNRSADLSRRAFLGLAGGLVGAGAVTSSVAYAIDRAMEADPAGIGSLADIDHFVLLMQENRSFDHYFGTMSGVRGFDDMSPDQAQPGYAPSAGVDPNGRLMPFHLDTHRYPTLSVDIINDPSHSWAAQHEAWNHGAMDAWMTTHLATDGALNAPEIMGYFTRADLPTHHLLADAFTVCDHYFSSVIGPTAPNRMYWMSGTLDPYGRNGGPLVGDAKAIPDGTLTWRTFPENLTDAGVSWKVYNSHQPAKRLELTGMLKYFRAYQEPESELYARGLAPRFPNDFSADVKSGELPAVSWLIPTMNSSEHPAFPPAFGANGIMTVLNILTSNRALWERTALIVSYDENGGFFDHVAPPVPSRGTFGEFVNGPRGPDHGVSATDPIGLGYRVPCLVISPYSRGGFVASDTFDHTSQLRLIGARFGVPVPNLTPWRRSTVGDMTSTLHQIPRRDPVGFDAQTVLAAAREAVVDDRAEVARVPKGDAPSYPVPPNSMPRQDRRPHRPHVG